MKFAALALALLAPFSGWADGRAFDIDVPPDGPLAFRGALAISPPSPEFAGLSGLDVGGGAIATMVSDKGGWARLRFLLEDGWLTGVANIETRPMLGKDGEALQDEWLDAEDLARAPDGGYWVSFEHEQRLALYDRDRAAPLREVRPDEWLDPAGNTGPEGLAIDPAGHLWAIREFPGPGETAFPVLIYDGREWRRQSIPRTGPHGVTGASFGPDGRLYLTMRSFSFVTGFEIQIRRLTWRDGEIAGDEVLLDLPAGSMIDNIEGIDLWREGGRTYLMVISDDNGFLLQQNVLALFEVTG